VRGGEKGDSFTGNSLNYWGKKKVYGTALTETQAPKKQIGFLKLIFLFQFPWKLDIKSVFLLKVTKVTDGLRKLG